MKKSIFLLVFASIAILASCHERTTMDTLNVKVIKFPDGTSMSTALTVGGQADWNTMLHKPTVFPPATHEHPTLYRSITWFPDWVGVTGKPTQFAPLPHRHVWGDLDEKPTEIELKDELPKLKLLPLPAYTTAQINALTPGLTEWGIVLNKETMVVKLWTGTKWINYIMSE